ncbi:MAG: hypothetical protein ACFFEE_12770 [Candidatus Thorarchaeota archaeon]
MASITESITSQFKSGLKMVKDAIENVPDSRWHDGSGKWFFSQTVYQILEAMDFYLGSKHEEMKWGKRAGYVWVEDIDIKKDILPKLTKELVEEYLSEIQNKLTSVLGKASEDSLLKKDGFDWFSCVLEKLQYALRHTAHHCGELNLMLRIWDAPTIKWT